jgi:hypothetical protein
MQSTRTSIAHYLEGLYLKDSVDRWIRYLFKKAVYYVMKRLLLAIAIFLVLATSIANSLTAANVQYYVNTYNNRIDQAPSVLKGILGNEMINIDIIQNDGSVQRFGFVVKNARIDNVVQGGLNNSTINVVTTESAINNIKSSNDPVAEFQKERDVGQVRIEGTNPITSAKISALLSSTSVLEYFYNIFFG